jgi:hypothetical protein
LTGKHFFKSYNDGLLDMVEYSCSTMCMKTHSTENLCTSIVCAGECYIHINIIEWWLGMTMESQSVIFSGLNSGIAELVCEQYVKIHIFHCFLLIGILWARPLALTTYRATNFSCSNIVQIDHLKHWQTFKALGVITCSGALKSINVQK